MASKYQLINKKDRAILHEGRIKGIGTALAKKDGNTFTTAYPLSACKDYLAEECVTEYNGVSYTKHGLTSHKQNLFTDGNAYMIISILKDNEGGFFRIYDGYKDEIKTLRKNYKYLQNFLNWFEQQLNLDNRTVIEKIKLNYYVATFPLFWTKNSYLISLYGLLIRAGMYYEGQEDIMNFLKTFNKNQEDSYLINSVYDKIELVLKGIIPEQKVDKDLHCPHDQGFLAWQAPKKC